MAMKDYRVRLTALASVSVYLDVFVEAESENEARYEAVELWFGRKGLRARLMFLMTYAQRRGCMYDRRVPGQRTECSIYPDFAPNSLSFVIDFIRNGEKAKNPMCGGLIYYGPDSPSNGSGSSLTVSLSRDSGAGWSIHT